MVFVEISDIILGKIHLSEAPKVISHITKTQFSGESKNEDLQKKYIFWYVAHDLIFKSKNLSLETQTLEGSTEPIAIDKLQYIYQIGDNLAQWTSYLCFDLGESDYYRLNEVL